MTHITLIVGPAEVLEVGTLADEVDGAGGGEEVLAGDDVVDVLGWKKERD